MKGILCVCVYYLVLIFPLFQTESVASVATTSSLADSNAKQDEVELLIKLARDYRKGTKNIERNLPRAVHFYQYTIEKAKGRILREAISELLGILEEHSQLESKFSSWDLLLAAAAQGEEGAQHRLSAAVASGIYQNSLVPMDITRSLLLEYVAALSGSPEAAMGMGYRYSNGIGLVQSCEKALPFFEFAANTAIEFIEQKNGYTPIPDRTRLSDNLEHSFRLLKESSNELTDYYSHLADNGEATAASLLGNIYTTGSKNIDPDEDLAIYYLKLAFKLHSHQSGGLLGYLLAKKYQRNRLNGGKEVNRKPHAKEKEYFDHREDTPEKIASLLQSSSKTSDLNGIVGLGFIYANGIGVEVNQTKALEYFQKALPSHPDAGFYIGEIIMKQQSQKLTPPSQTTTPPQTGWRNHEITAALHAYSTSAQLGSIFSQHRLAQMHNHGWGGSRSCESAVSGFRAVAERGPWSAQLAVANRDYNHGDYGKALSKFASLASIGYEVAQYNAAYILFKSYCPTSRYQSSNRTWLLEMFSENSQDPEQVREQFEALNYVTSLPITASSSQESNWRAKQRFGGSSDNLQVTKKALASNGSSTVFEEQEKEECDVRALSLFSLSAAQGNSDAFVQIGDFYYYRFEQYNQSRQIAASYYQKAADLHNTQAVFNLGLMHEIGDGVQQDFHLAKRYYDLAAEVDAKARTPRDIALFMLEGHKSILSFMRSDFVSKFCDPTECEQLFYQAVRAFLFGLRSLDESIFWLNQQVKSWFLPQYSAHQQSSRQAPSFPVDKVVVEDYIPEQTKFQFLKISDTLQRYYSRVINLLKVLSTELQHDFGMKEEEASLFILLTFFLIALLSLQLFLFCIARYIRMQQ